MRGFLVKLAGFALYVHNLQSGKLNLLHERPNREPTVYALNEEDFEENADELDDETLAALEPGVKASTVGLSLRLIKNDGVLKVTFEEEYGGVDWTFQGLRSTNMGCAFTQTISEVAVRPELSNSTIQTVSTNPIRERIVQPPASGLSIISTTETRPVKPMMKPAITIKTPNVKLNSGSSTVNKENSLKRKAVEDVEQPKPPKLAKSKHNSPLWPGHIYMECARTQPISKSVGFLHIDLIEGKMWFEGWHGKPDARVFEKRQVDLCDVSTTVEYYKGIADYGCTHYLKITKRNGSNNLAPVFTGCCSAPGWQTFGSDMDVRLCFDPNPSLGLRAKERFLAKNPDSPTPGWKTDISHTLVVDAIVHCIDRATERTPVHDPETDHKLWADLERLTRFRKPGRMSGKSIDKAEEKVQEVRERHQLRSGVRKVEGEAEENKARDAEIDEMENLLD